MFIKHIIPNIILPKKISVIQGKYILENVIVVLEDMKWDQPSNIYAFFINIDFEKSYD
jgi:hypothetical protein